MVELTTDLIVIGAASVLGVGFGEYVRRFGLKSPLWMLEVRRHPGHRFPPPKYPPGMPNYLAKHDEFNALCKTYEADLVKMGGTADPAEVARAVAEQLRLPYKYERDHDGYWETRVYFQGHPSRKFMLSGTVGTYGAKNHERSLAWGRPWPEDSPLAHKHWTDGILGSMGWR